MKKNKIKIGFTIAKYLFSLLVTVVSWVRVENLQYFIVSLIELGLIICVSNMMVKKKLLGYMINSVLVLFYNIQMIVLAFANSFVSMVMLTNIDSLDALSGKAGLYIGAVITTLIFSFLPISDIAITGKINNSLFGVFLYAEFLGIVIVGKMFSPFYGYVDLGIQHYQAVQLAKEIEGIVESSANDDVREEEMESNPEKMSEERRNVLMTTDYYQEEIQDYRPKNELLAEKPNVILIFTEGLSQNVISDNRNLMPNVKKYQEKSISFDNYCNHTFATYRGLICQLFSGYQWENYDSNYLVSLQEILGREGYKTSFINTEPNNEEFTAYLNAFGFEQVYGDESSKCNGAAGSIADEDAYELLFQIAEENSDGPFFVSIYTFGTHASLASTQQKYGDGRDEELNKFYNVDYQFGKFMKKFEKSDWADDTIVIFTSDHATYQDDSFSAAFPQYERSATSLDEIPFFIYHKGIKPEMIDVGGRNSICLAPTILDYLDISDENCFVGTSLFSEQANSICETTYSDTCAMYSSEGGNIRLMSAEELEEFKEYEKKYYISKALAETAY